ncbi:MAG: hypothetical protein A2Y07_07390 [Planctomycetes bacterium GWF2_50_10]|nr:MAG: hypothetical protein A2Y07_07390 [Planctomycetes bacterium GWF2_50_10]
MKALLLCALCVVFAMSLAGCENKWASAGLGAAGGAAAGVGGYEYHFKKEKDNVEQAYKDGKIDARERDIRLDQIQRDSLFQK